MNAQAVPAVVAHHVAPVDPALVRRGIPTNPFVILGLHWQRLKHKVPLEPGAIAHDDPETTADNPVDCPRSI